METITQPAFTTSPDMKRCSKCGETKAKTEFSKSTNSRDQIQGYCKICAGILQRDRQRQRITLGLCRTIGCVDAPVASNECLFHWVSKIIRGASLTSRQAANRRRTARLLLKNTTKRNNKIAQRQERYDAIDADLKTCSKCGYTKDKTDFSLGSSRSSDGLAERVQTLR